MKKAYLLIYSSELGTREDVKSWANALPVITWRYDLPNTFYLISEASASELYESLIAKLGKKGRFLIIEAGENRQGLLPPNTWHLLRMKTHKPQAATQPKLK